MEILKTILYVISTVVMALVIIFCPQACDNVCIFYVSILTTYLGLDVWNMIKSTSLLPPGEYKDIKIWRYVVCAVSYAFLIGLGAYISHKTGAELINMYAILTSAVFILIGILIGALEGNKLATGSKDKTE